MAKIGTAHVEIKPVVSDEALTALTGAIEKAVQAGVAAGMLAAAAEAKARPAMAALFKLTQDVERQVGIPHDHIEYVEGCFRCDLNRDER